MDYTLRIDTHAPWLKTQDQAADRQFRNSGAVPLADGAGHPCSPMEPRAAESAELRGAMRRAFTDIPMELQWAHRFIDLRKPKQESL